MGDQVVGTVSVDVVPSAASFGARLAAQVNQQADRIGTDLGKALGERIAAGIKAGIGSGFSGSPGREPGRRTGDEFAGEFDRTVRTKITAALKALPKAQIGAAATEAEQKIRDLRVRLEELSGKTIGVDIDGGAALAEIERIRVDLGRLGAQSPNVQVRADVGAALAQLAAVQVAADKLAGDNPTINVDVDAGAATAELAAVEGASIGGVQGISALTAAGIGLAPAIVPAAAAAVAAIAAIGPAAVAGGAAVGVLALGFSGVLGAVKAMQQAETQQGQAASTSATRNLSLAGAVSQVGSARRALANTTASAAASQARADEQVSNAERSLAQAQAESLRIQQTLTAAREEARRSLEDLNNQVADNALAQRQAALDLAAAQQAADLNPKDAQTLINLDQAKQRTAELAQQQQRLTADRDTAAKAGVDGSTQVVAAQQQIAAAAERVRQAEQQVSDARTAQAETARQAAFSIAQARQAVVSAQRSVQAASISAGAAGGAAMDKLKQSMASLSPAGREFATFLYGLKPTFDGLRQTAEAGLLPGVEAGIKALLPVMPAIRTAIGQVAAVLGELFRQAGLALASPFWQDFFQQMLSIGLPLLAQSGPLLLNMARGFAGILEAFAPLAPQIGAFLLTLSQRFADFGTSLAQSDGFKAFLDYVAANAPLLVQLFGSLLEIGIKLLIALAPLGEVLLRGLTALATFLAGLNPEALLAIIYEISAAIVILGLAFAPIPIAIGAVVVAVVALAAGLVYAYTHFQTFHDIVNAVWAGVKTAALVAWNDVLKPIFEAIAFTISNVVVPVVLWMWHNVWLPAWQGIQFAVSLVRAALEVDFGLIQIAFKILSTVIEVAWRTVIKPVFDIFAAIFAVTVVPAFKAGVDAIGKAWDAVRDIAKVPVKFVVDTVLNNGLLAGYNKLAKIFHVKPDDVHIDLPQGFAVGGRVFGAGTATSDSIPALLSNGEHVWTAREVAAAGGHGVVEAMRAAVIGGYATGGPVYRDGLPGYALGGIVGDLGKLISGAGNAILHPLDFLRSLADKAAGGLRDLVGDSEFGRVLLALPGAVLDQAGDFVKGLVGFGGSRGKGGTPPTGGPAPSAQLLAWITAAETATGVGPSWTPGLTTLIMRESGGNPRAINLVDQNAQRGDPSRGLMQTIGATFAAYRDRNLVNDIYDPVANIAAGINYILARYGGLGAVQQANPLLPPKGYDSGGWLPQGLTLAYNGLGSPEPVGETAIKIGEARGAAQASRTSTITINGVDGTDLISRLQAWQDRQDALDRVGRPG